MKLRGVYVSDSCVTFSSLTEACDANTSATSAFDTLTNLYGHHWLLC